MGLLPLFRESKLIFLPLNSSFMFIVQTSFLFLFGDLEMPHYLIVMLQLNHKDSLISNLCHQLVLLESIL